MSKKPEHSSNPFRRWKMPGNENQPSDLHPSLSWHRLIYAGRVFRERRDWVAENATPERGDTLCGIGFRAWEQTKRQFAIEAATEQGEWLGIQPEKGKFILTFGGVPIQFCRGDSEDALPDNYSFAGPCERSALKQAWEELGTDPIDGFLRFRIASDRAGFTTAVYLVQYNRLGEPVVAWKIPEAEDGSGTAPIVAPLQPIVLPVIELQTHDEAAEEARRQIQDANRRETREGA